MKIYDKKWIEINDLSSGQFSARKNERSKTSMLKLDLYNYSDAYIVVTGTIDLLAAAAGNENDEAQKCCI